MQYERLYLQSVEDPDAFWAERAREFYWETPWHEEPGTGRVHSENLDVRKGQVYAKVGPTGMAPSPRSLPAPATAPGRTR